MLGTKDVVLHLLGIVYFYIKCLALLKLVYTNSNNLFSEEQIHRLLTDETKLSTNVCNWIFGVGGQMNVCNSDDPNTVTCYENIWNILHGTKPNIKYQYPIVNEKINQKMLDLGYQNQGIIENLYLKTYFSL
jgi:hypothetical protein